jgi:hypothetical protein
VIIAKVLEIISNHGTAVTGEATGRGFAESPKFGFLRCQEKKEGKASFANDQRRGSQADPRGGEAGNHCTPIDAMRPNGRNYFLKRRHPRIIGFSANMPLVRSPKGTLRDWAKSILAE